jgi:hypothetical protein
VAALQLLERLTQPTLQERMPPKRHDPDIADTVLGPDTSLLDVLDHVLNKGVSATGDVTLGVAGIDLIYLRLSALLCAADRVLPRSEVSRPARSRHRQPGRRK